MSTKGKQRKVNTSISAIKHTKVLLRTIVFEEAIEFYGTEISKIINYIIPATEEDITMLKNSNLKTPDHDELPVRRLLYLLGKNFIDYEDYDGDSLLEGEDEMVHKLLLGDWKKYKKGEDAINIQGEGITMVFSFIFN